MGDFDHRLAGDHPGSPAAGGTLRWAARYGVFAVIGAVLVAVFVSVPEETPGSADGVAPVAPPPAEAPPAEVAPTADYALGEQYIEAGPRGHFIVDATVNGYPVTFFVDTGASKVVLRMDDARRLGLDPAYLTFSERHQTANGIVRGAPVTLREIRIGPLSIPSVEASVTEAPLTVSLLGMSFLRRLRGYEVRNDRLVLRW